MTPYRDPLRSCQRGVSRRRGGKRDFNDDLFGDPITGAQVNPGGGGLPIFVGLAKPLPPK